MMDSCSDPGQRSADCATLVVASLHPHLSIYHGKAAKSPKTHLYLKINEAKMQLRTLASFKNLYTRHFGDTLTFSVVHPSNFIYKLFYPEVRLGQKQQTNG